MKLKISQTQAIETGFQRLSQDISLNGTSNLCSCGPSLKDHAFNDDTNTFLKVFGLENKFFYVIELIEDNITTRYERGLGYIYKVDNTIYLKQSDPILTGPNRSCCSPCNNKPTCFASNEGILIIHSYIPTSHLETMVDPHTVLTSSGPCFPHPVVLENNTVLGRLSGNIQPISLNSELFINPVTNYKKPLNLKTSRLLCGLFNLKPQTQPQPNKCKKGDIIYNESSNQLQYYNGSNWRTLSNEGS